MKPKTSNGGSKNHRVFIVDDHPLVREGLSNLINQQTDMNVCGEAEDSASAMSGIQAIQPDVVLVDISLKNESGLELVKTLKNQYPDLAVIVISMHDEALYAERALPCGRPRLYHGSGKRSDDDEGNSAGVGRTHLPERQNVGSNPRVRRRQTHPSFAHRAPERPQTGSLSINRPRQKHRSKSQRNST